VSQDRGDGLPTPVGVKKGRCRLANATREVCLWPHMQVEFPDRISHVWRIDLSLQVDGSPSTADWFTSRAGVSTGVGLSSGVAFAIEAMPSRMEFVSPGYYSTPQTGVDTTVREVCSTATDSQVQH